ncbi:hypothetical protein [Megalodesulfovibrio paquesii]
MRTSCGQSLADMPPRVQCLSVFLGGGVVFTLAALVLHREDPVFAASWVGFLTGVLLTHALIFLFFVDAIERQAQLFLMLLRQPAGILPHRDMPLSALEAVLFSDPLDQGNQGDQGNRGPWAGQRARMAALPLPAPQQDAEEPSAVWQALPGQAVLGVFLLLSLAVTLTMAVAIFPGARQLSGGAVTMPGALACLALLGGGALAAQRMRAAQTMDLARRETLREALAGVFGTMDWHVQAPTDHVSGRSTLVRKERQELEGRPVARGVIVTREETFQDRAPHLARVELLLDPAALPHRVLMALLRLAAGVPGLKQDLRALSPLGLECAQDGSCRRHGRDISHAELLAMAMRLAQHLLARHD